MPVGNFPLSFPSFIGASPPFFPLSFPFLFPPFLLTLLLLPCPFLSGPNVYFAPEPEAGGTHTDEVGRSKAASPTLSSGASIKERVIVFLLLLISVLSSYLFLSVLPSTLLPYCPYLLLLSPPS